jgi:hypothetical protein
MPTWFLAPIAGLKLPTQMSDGAGYLFLYTVSVFQSLVSEKTDIVDIDPDWTSR